MIDEILKALKDDFEKTISKFSGDLSKMRTGRANLAILDGIKVEYYGVPTPLNQIAALNVPDPKLIVIKPWDKKLIVSIEKAIVQGGLGITPTNDGDVIRLPIPPLTVERRKELVKLIKKNAEEAKVNLRNIRRDANEKIKKDETIPEDDMYKGLKKTQEETDKYIAKIDEMVSKKEKEIMED